MERSILLKNIYKSYGLAVETDEHKQYALDNICLSIKEGDRLGIIGENGAGKSTLLSIISGISSTTSGEMTIQGKVNAILSLGLGLREDFTGRENFYLCGEMQGKTRKEVDVDMEEMIEFSELKEFIDRPVRIYSTGMKSKLAFTCSVFIQPEILIIDEALSVGDRWFTGKATQKMKSLCEGGKILLLVSHSLASIVDMCNRCIWISEGKIKEEGSPKEVTEKYHQFISKKKEDKLKSAFSFVPGILKNQSSMYLNNLVFCINGIPFNNQVTVDENEHFSIKVNLHNNHELQNFISKIGFTIERLDGFCVAEHYLTEVKELHNKKEMTLSLDCGAMKLKPGYYKSMVSLYTEQKILDSIQGIFQVSSDNIVSGGTPAIRWMSECAEIKLNETLEEHEHAF